MKKLLLILFIISGCSKEDNYEMKKDPATSTTGVAVFCFKDGVAINNPSYIHGASVYFNGVFKGCFTQVYTTAGCPEKLVLNLEPGTYDYSIHFLSGLASDRQGQIAIDTNQEVKVEIN